MLLEHPDCRTDHAKYVGVGTAVFFTALFAVASSSYALYYVFETWAVVGLGLVWGLFIFSLDRYIVSTMRKGIGKSREWGLAIPRLVIAMFLAAVISKPLELKIFQKEINNQLQILDVKERTRLAADVLSQHATRRNQLIMERSILTNELNTARQRRDEQQRREADELNGSSGSKRYGRGPAYEREKLATMILEKELQNVEDKSRPLLNQNQSELGVLATSTQQAIAARQDGYQLNNGLLGRIGALGVLTASNPSLNNASSALLILFILIETAPVLVKLLSPAGPYDFKLNAVERRIETQEIERISQANEEVNRSLQITLGENEQVVAAQLHGNQELLSRLNKAQLDIAQEMIDQWKAGELQKLRQPEPFSAN
jgi:hypothetical protein